jgi:DNA modification methylase
MDVVEVSVSDLATMGAPYNPRRIDDHDMDALRRSLRYFGTVEPIVVNRRSGRIVGGHQRVKAAQAESMASLPVVYVDLDDPSEKQLNIALNRIHGEWEPELLSSLLRELEAEGADLALTGFADLELTRLLALANEGMTDPDEVPPLDVVTHARTGDVILMGGHRLVCGDSTDTAVIESACCDRRAMLVVTSPPYNCGIDYDVHDDSMSPDKYLELIRRVAAAVVDHCLDDGGVCAWNVGVTPKTMHTRHAAILEGVGLKYLRQIVWRKSGVAYPIWQFTTAECKARRYTPNYQHEIVFLFSKGDVSEGQPGSSQPDDDLYCDVWDIVQSQATVGLKIAVRKGSNSMTHGSHNIASHPAAFPVQVPSGVIRHMAAKGDLVFDPFAGSGSSLIACEILGRTFAGVEMSPAYCDVIVKRWQDFTGKKAEGWRGNA